VAENSHNYSPNLGNQNIRQYSSNNQIYRVSRNQIHASLISLEFNPLKGTLKPQSNRALYSNTVIGTLAVDGWAVAFSTARRGLGGLPPRPVPSLLYQMQQPTHQRLVYQLHIIRCSTTSTYAH